jgi:ubiquinone/menaquinone biosynthesis C-methylase UbiE
MSLLQNLYAQFSKPRGALGEVVGWALALRPSNRRRARWTLALLDAQPGDELLDVGCGPGVALEMAVWSTALGSATGLDHSEAMLNQARRRLARAREKRRFGGRVELLHAELEDPHVEGRRFDRICSMNVIQFFPDQAKAVGALKALLKPGGRLATTYQPRGAKPTREAALAMAETLSSALEQLGFINVRVDILELRPAPAVCVQGDLPSAY